MEKKISSWKSAALQKEMPIAEYGTNGFALLMVPPGTEDYLKYEQTQIINSIKQFIEEEKVKVYCINSVDEDSWLNNNIPGEEKVAEQNRFNNYVCTEVVPFIRQSIPEDAHIYTCGASMGALHAVNLFLKYPGMFNGTIGMSGTYDLTNYTNGYWDEQVYFNSPEHYIGGLVDEVYLKQIRSSHHIHLYTGSGNNEDTQSNKQFSELLWDKGIWHDFEQWGCDIHHDWPYWRMMLPYIIREKY